MQLARQAHPTALLPREVARAEASLVALLALPDAVDAAFVSTGVRDDAGHRPPPGFKTTVWPLAFMRRLLSQ